MTAQDLKNSILQLAVQGKLVPQDPSDEPASELLKRIQAEKAKLIKDGKIKKEKPLPAIADEEKPFDIPDSWAWARLGDYCLDAFSGKSPVYSKTPTQYFIIGQAANQQSGLDYSQLKYTTSDFWKSMEEKYFLLEGDVLLNTLGNGTLGRAGIIDKLDKQLLTDGHLFVFRHISGISAKYFYYFLQYKRPEIEKAANGSTNQTFLSLKKTNLWLVPVPPLAEQKRIVEKIEQVMPLVEEYGKTEGKIKALNAEFPDKLRKSILQQAVQGKLTERNPSDEPASELLKRIRTEKAKLVAEGKIKKEKPLPAITDEEKPFDIPDTWEWVRLDDLYSVGTGMTPLKGNRSFYENGTIPWITSSLTSNRYIDYAESYITEYALEETSLELYPENTILIAMYGQGKTRGQISELLIPATVNQACAALTAFSKEDIFNQYIYFYFQYYYETLRKKAEGSSQPNLNLTKIRECVVPIPTLAEQKRIVARVEELLVACDGLK